MYRIKDSDRLREVVDETANPSNLDEELGLVRLVIEKSYDQDQISTVLSGLNTLTKVSLASQASLIRSSEHLSKKAVISFARQSAQILIDVLENRFDQSTVQAIVDDYLGRLTPILSDTNNDNEKRISPLKLGVE